MNNDEFCLKVLQYNIYFGTQTYDIDIRLKNICNCIINAGADVICLQEILRSKYELLKKYLFFHYPFELSQFNKSYHDTSIMNFSKMMITDELTNIDTDAIDSDDTIITHDTIIYDTVIMSKYPIEKATTINYKYTNMNRNIKIVLINKYDMRVYICTTHFESEFGINISNKIYQYRQCAKVLLNLYNSTKIPIILCTDSNICKQSEYEFYSAFSFANGWKDSWIELKMNPSIEITYDPCNNPILKNKYRNKYNVEKFRSRLDRILHISNAFNGCNTYETNCEKNTGLIDIKSTSSIDIDDFIKTNVPSSLNTINMALIGNTNDIILSDHYGILCEFSSKNINKYPYMPIMLSPYVDNNKEQHKNIVNTDIDKRIANYTKKKLQKKIFNKYVKQ